MIKRALSRLLFPFRSRRSNYKGRTIPQSFYHKFVTYESFNNESNMLREKIRELKGLVHQLAARDKLKPLNGVLMTEKEHEIATKAMERRIF